MGAEIVEFVKAQLAIDEQLALATTPVPVPGRWRAAQDKHAADDAQLSLIQGRDEIDDSGYVGYSYGNPVIVHAADWQDEAEANLRHIERHDPARVLADVEAKRYLLDWCAEVTARFDWSTLNQPGSLWDDPNARATHTAVVALKSMAAPYAGQPGYKPEWRLP